MPQAKRQGGFSLIEVLVAFLILAASLSVLSRVFAAGMGQSVQVQERMQALSFAQSALERIQSEGLLQRGDSSGEFDERYHWHRHVTLREDLTPRGHRLRAYEVKLRVNWQQGSKQRQVDLSTLVLAAAQ